jgi:hypothetical protein
MDDGRKQTYQDRLDKLISDQKARLKLKPQKPKRLSNIDRVHHMMNFSNHGALSQLFIMEAINFYSNLIKKQGPPTEEEEKEDHGIISKMAWYRVAVEVQQSYQEHIDSHKG